MYKKIFLVTGLVAFIGLLIFGAVNRTLARNEDQASGRGSYGLSQEAWSPSNVSGLDENQGLQKGKGRQGGSGRQGQPDEHGSLPQIQSGSLSAEEAESLIFMREEEKLARDVYQALYSQWGVQTFQNIAASEQVHMDAVKTLLDRYGLTDPAVAQAGVFTNPDLQALYDQLIARGSQSLAEALKVGAAVEEIDILDLEKRLTQIDNMDIQQMFNNLLNGSKNHLRAFSSALKAQTGETYSPQYLSDEVYQAIMNETGGGNKQRRGPGGRWGAGGG